MLGASGRDEKQREREGGREVEGAGGGGRERSKEVGLKIGFTMRQVLQFPSMHCAMYQGEA